MSAKSESNLRAAAAPFLEPGEEVVSTWIASVRGHQQAMAGGVAGLVGGSRAGRASRDAAEAGITLASPMAFVLTPSHLVIVEVGNGGKVKRTLDSFDLADVGPMTVKRLGLGASVTIVLAGVEVRLESRVGASRAFAEALDQVTRADR
ncbi:MAG: hypothetical protein QM747_02130 [Nocardioides sp.]